MVTGRHCCALKENGPEGVVRLGRLGSGHNEFDCVTCKISQKINIFFKMGMWALTSF